MATIKYTYKERINISFYCCGVDISLPYCGAINITMPIADFKVFALDSLALGYLDQKKLGAIDNIVLDIA